VTEAEKGRNTREFPETFECVGQGGNLVHVGARQTWHDATASRREREALVKCLFRRAQQGLADPVEQVYSECLYGAGIPQR
jgi:hypothetical protein